MTILIACVIAAAVSAAVVGTLQPAAEHWCAHRDEAL